MKFSNNMENNIQNLNIKKILEQEFAENSLDVLEFGDLDTLACDRFGNLLKKHDKVFLDNVRKKLRLKRVQYN